MKAIAKLVDLATGDSPAVVMSLQTVRSNGFHAGDRVLVSAGGRSVIAALDTMRGRSLEDGQMGLFIETAQELGVKDGAEITVAPAPKPESIDIIKKRMDKTELSEDEILAVVRDIVNGRLTQVEIAFFVAACSINPLSFKEMAALTRATADTGMMLHFEKKVIIDKHCIGGVPNNRTSMITVPIMASLGYTVPKTSSRAITSPAGTADTLEVLTEVNLTVERMMEIVNTTGACLAWGGSVKLAPADDRIIRVERPMSIDAQGFMISSIMAKKYAAGSTHVVIDIPCGAGAKVKSMAEALELKEQFETIGSLLGMHVLVIITDGSQTIGNGVGPLLEAYDVLAVLQNDFSAPQDLREKSLMIAGLLLEFIGHCEKGQGRAIAEQQLISGAAWRKFNEIIDAQGRKELPPLGRFVHYVTADAAGTVSRIDNFSITRVSRIAGAPMNKNAGLLLYVKVGAQVTRGERLFAIFAENEDDLKNAVAYVGNDGNPYRFS